MNNLSWFLYSVNVIDNVSWMLSALIVIVAIVEGLTLLMFAPVWDACDDEGKAIWKKTLKVSTISFLVLFFILALLPSSRTMYLILGSEIGEDVIKSETARKVHDVVNRKLDEYLEIAID